MSNPEMMLRESREQIASIASSIEQQIELYRFGWWEGINASAIIELPTAGKIGIDVRGIDEGWKYIGIDIYEVCGMDWRCVRSGKTIANVSGGLLTWIENQVMDYENQVKKANRNRKKQKYRKGEPVRSMDDLLQQEFVYFHHKITHRGWFLSWQLKFALDMLNRGVIYYAIRKESGND